MTRDDLLSMLGSAQVPYPDVQIVVVGSQSVLGAHSDQELPERATLSVEADVMYRRHGTYDEELTDLVDATFGEGSAFHEENGVYLQGVGETTCVLPDGWNDRLVTLAVLPLRAGGSMPVLCLDPHDLAVAKLAAGRPKDIEFVHALLGSGHLDLGVIDERAQQLDPVVHPGRRGQVLGRLRSLRPR